VVWRNSRQHPSLDTYVRDYALLCHIPLLRVLLPYQTLFTPTQPRNRATRSSELLWSLLNSMNLLDSETAHRRPVHRAFSRRKAPFISWTHYPVQARLALFSLHGPARGTFSLIAQNISPQPHALAYAVAFVRTNRLNMRQYGSAGVSRTKRSSPRCITESCFEMSTAALISRFHHEEGPLH
jgi:hypothetical protein